MSWFGVRGFAGIGDGMDYVVGEDYPEHRLTFWGGGEVVLFTLLWDRFYWEILRVGGGWPLIAYWGSAFGYPFRLDGAGRHQIRVGAHLTFLFGYNPFLSGAQLYYQYRLSRLFAIQVGVMQHSWPTGGVLTVGVSL